MSGTLITGTANLRLRLETTVPSAVRRRTPYVSECHSVISTLRRSADKKLSRRDSGSRSLPDGWRRVKHPSSEFYYVNDEKNLFTWSDVLQPRTYSLVMDGADMLQQSAALQAFFEDERVSLVLDVQYRKGVMKTSYYCVSHIERRVFWLEGIGHEEVDIPCTSKKCKMFMGSRKHCVEMQYWKHCELFPTTFTVTAEIIGELKNILLQARADRLLLKFSTSPYEKDDLEHMLNLVKEIETDAWEWSGYPGWIVARLMSLHNSGMLQSSYGQNDDYFDIEDTRPDAGPYRRPVLLTILRPLFFKSPDAYAAELHMFRESFTLLGWLHFVNKVDQSVRDSNLLATVLLSTNVGLLAWSETGKTSGINSPTTEQIVIYISIICSIGSIITGFAVSKQYRGTGPDTPLRVVEVLKRILNEPMGLERLAIICSLPYVLLMWSLIAFLVVFGIIFYKDTGIQVRIPVTLTFFFVCIFLFFCTYTIGSPNKEDQEPTREEARVPSKV